MSSRPNLLSLLHKLQTGLAARPHLGWALALLGMALMGLLALSGHHRHEIVWIGGDAISNGLWAQGSPLQGQKPDLRTLWLANATCYSQLWLQLVSCGMLLQLLRHFGHWSRLRSSCWLASGSYALWAVLNDLGTNWLYLIEANPGEPFSSTAYLIKLVMILLASFTPAALLEYYQRCDLLARYTLRSVLGPLLFCFCAFTALWLIMDLLDNLKDFQEAKASLGRVLSFYAGILPFIYVTVMPASLLLAALYGLSRLSQSNEITAMLSAGRSLPEILRPVLILSAALSLLSMAANYHWAPRAEGNKEAVLNGMSHHQGDSIRLSSVLHETADGKRLWFIASIPFSMSNGTMRGVHLHQRGPNGQWIEALVADAASWNLREGWKLLNGHRVTYENGSPQSMRRFDSLGLKDIEETPWSMMADRLDGDAMGVPELCASLQSAQGPAQVKTVALRAHLHHRFAMPWQSFCLMLAAAPLGIAYSRRSAAGGIARALGLFFVLMFLNNLCLNLGRGAHLPAWFSNWLPHLLLAVVGWIVFVQRSSNREWSAAHWLAQWRGRMGSNR